MILSRPRLAIPVAGAMAALALFGVGDAHARTHPGEAGSPCRSSGSVATWSPSGKQIAFVGYGGRSAALCVADVDGRHARPLRHATCPRRGYCSLINFPTQLFWATPKLLLYGDWAKGIFAVPLGGKPKRIGALSDAYDRFSVDAAGDRVAHGSSSCCSTSRGPVTVLGLPSGRVIGKIGGSKTANFFPSLSPDGKRVVFIGGQPTEVRTASVTGDNRRTLPQCNSDPVWSPTGKWIACLGPPEKWPNGPALLLVSPQGDTSVTVTRASLGARNIFGWSPDGWRIAFSAENSGSGSKLDVVDLATDKLRTLRSPAGSDVAWSPDSRRLLVTSHCKIWLVHAVGRQRPRLLRTGSSGTSC